jgi:putative ABC transport system permease protein
VSVNSLPINIIRFRDGTQQQNGERDLALIATRLANLAGEPPRGVLLRTYAVHTAKFQFGSLHYALIAAVVAVLLVACANLANMQLARGIGRSRELALRAALGATRGDIVRHLVLESAILAAAGLALGVLLTFWGTHFLSSRIPPAVAEYVIAPQTSWRVFAFAVVAGLFCVFLVGLLPAIRVSRVDPNEPIKSGAGTGTHRRSRRQYGGMVIVEMGLSLALLCGAAIVVRTAITYRAMRVGFDVTPLATAWLRAESNQSATVHYTEAQADILSRARRIPGVADAAVAFHASARHHAVTVLLAGGVSKQVPAPLYGYGVVTPSYLHTFGIPIVEGRDFTDGVAGKPEVIVDQATARFLWPGGSAVGRAIKLGDDTSSAPWAKVIGVAKSLQRSSWSVSWTFDGMMPVLANRLGALYYRPSDRDSVIVPPRGYTVDVTIRAKGDPTRLPIALRRQFMASPPYQLLTAQSMDEKLGLLCDRQRHDFIATTFMVFALLALGLAALGIYGIIAHSVAERTREIGVRIALGANARDVLHAVLREGNAIALGGVAFGLICTRQTIGWLRDFSFPEDQYDATLFAAMGAALFVVALLSALWPALRATRIDPVEALRSE